MLSQWGMAIRLVGVRRQCDEDWDNMAGDAQRRHCARCDRPVVNLSMLTLDEARRVLTALGPAPCTNAVVDENGLAQLRATPYVPLGTARSPARHLVAGAALTLVLASASASAHADSSVPPAGSAPGETAPKAGKPNATKGKGTRPGEGKTKPKPDLQQVKGDIAWDPNN